MTPRPEPQPEPEPESRHWPTSPAEEAEPPAEGAEPESPRSGLRNPTAAVRGLGAGALLIEAIVLLLAIQPLRMLGGRHVGWGVAAVIALAALALVLAGLLRYQVTWYLVGALNLGVALTGYFQWALAVIGVVFALVWWYVLHVRRTILGR